MKYLVLVQSHFERVA